MNFIDLVKKRESVRGYLDKSVEREKIERCIECARLAPSACNSQPWKFIVVDDKDMVQSLAKKIYDPLVSGINKFTLTSPCFIAVVSQKRNLTSKIGSIVKKKDYTSIDLGIATEHICLAATELGLGTCIIGWFKEKEIKDILKVPKNLGIEVIISIGYFDNKNPREKNRKNIDEILSYNEY